MASSLSIFFDLDSCLCAAEEIGPQLYLPAFEAIRKANARTLPDEALSQAFAEMWRFPFDDVATRFGFSEAMWESGFRAFSNLVVSTPMYGYGDLGVLRELPARLFLITSGFRRLQESKIAALRIAEIFEAIYIDAIDEPNPRGKVAIFSELLDQFGLRADQAIVVGDNPDSEIAAGNSLGITTVQILRPGVLPGGNAVHTIADLNALKVLVHSMAAKVQS
ncbi:MAG: HAD family hydrolase [Steroidobacteraceae bacterium]